MRAPGSYNVGMYYCWYLLCMIKRQHKQTTHVLLRRGSHYEFENIQPSHGITYDQTTARELFGAQQHVIETHSIVKHMYIKCIHNYMRLCRQVWYIKGFHIQAHCIIICWLLLDNIQILCMVKVLWHLNCVWQYICL